MKKASITVILAGAGYMSLVAVADAQMMQAIVSGTGAASPPPPPPPPAATLVWTDEAAHVDTAVQLVWTDYGAHVE